MNFLPEVNHLIETVGMAEQRLFRDPAASQRYLLKHGKPQAVPLTPTAILTSSFWPWKTKLRMAMEPFIAASAADSQESVADFIRRRFGRELFEQAIDPFVAGTLSGDPEQACIQSVMPQFYSMEQQYGSIIRGMLAAKKCGSHGHYPKQLFSFKQGMEALPAAIARYLGKRVRTGVTVQSIERSGRDWRLTANCASGAEQIDADAIVVATPATAAARLLSPLSELLAGQVNGVPYAPMAVISLGFPTQAISHPMDGMGCLIPAREQKHMLGLFWNSALFANRAPDDHALITCYAGGMRNPDMLEHDDAHLLALILDDLRGMVAINGEPEFVRIIRHARGLPQYHLGHQQRLATIKQQLHLLPGLYLAGNYLDGVSVRDRIAKGKTLAQRILQQIAGSDADGNDNSLHAVEVDINRRINENV